MSDYTQKEIDEWGGPVKTPSGLTRDNEGRRCSRCKKGTYQERSIHDDIDGTRTCTNCYHAVPRWETTVK